MQQDALDALKLQQLLLEPEFLENVEADVHFVATLVSLKSVIPARTRDTARQVVAKVVAELERKLTNPLLQAVARQLEQGHAQRPPRGKESTGTAPFART